MAPGATGGVTLVHPAIADGVEALSDRVFVAVAAIAGTVGVGALLSVGYVAATGPSSGRAPVGVGFAGAGAGLLVAVGGLWWLFDERERAVAFPFRRPSPREVAVAGAFVPVGVAAFEVGVGLASALGFEYGGFSYDLTDPVTAAGVLIGPVLLAPLLEEALFRGALLGSLLGRGLSPVAAGVATVVVFAGLHASWLGVAGALGIAAWAVFPTVLRLRFDDLSTPVLLHFLNNVYAYVVAVAVLG